MRSAVIIGASGIVGSALAEHLAGRRWRVYGVARHPAPIAGVEAIAADVQDGAALRKAFAAIAPTHLYISAWLRQSSEAENIRVNRAMVKNVLDALSPTRSLEHAALVTGLKHYLGPFEAYGKGRLPETPFRESQARLDVDNFYYAQEDELFAAAARDGFHWTVVRPHTVIGAGVGHAMNMGVTLAVYASLCRETNRAFVFPGSRVQWDSLTDMTDARLLAHHLEWATTTEGAADQAFNVVNGDVFRWRWMWSRIAEWFGLTPAPFPPEVSPLEGQLDGMDDAWRALAEKHDLVQKDIRKLASPWHTDADLGRPIEVVADMSKSRKLGFREFQPTDESFFDLFARLRDMRVIP